MSQMPVSRGIRVCEKVIFEEGTHNYSLINCFSHLPVAAFPSEPHDFIIHAVLSDGMGEMSFEVFLTYLEDDENVFWHQTKLRLTDRLRKYRLKLLVPDFVFPAAGKYQVGLLVEGELIDQTILYVFRKGNER